MWRKLLCVLSFLASLYLLAAAGMQAWLTAADPVQVVQHRMWYYLFLGAALVLYVVFGVLLRPRSVLHFCLVSVTVPPALYALAAVSHVGATWRNILLLLLCCGYLLWRLAYIIRRLNN